VSHELRSPLASIVGSASILIEAPAIVADARLSALLAVVRDEAERLNHDIQNLLDASRISSAGVRPHLEWADPVDIVNAAVDSRRRLAPQHIELDLPDDLPLVHVDPVLIQQALAQVIGNALTYSAPESTVRIAASGQNGAVEIVVADQGAGLSSEERSRMLEKFYRGPRHHATVAGSGLGLWIAHAFVTACGGTLEPASPGIGRGTTITLKLAATQQSPSAPPGAADD
jgi:two-component system sensor histidine kinase KdpD